MDEYIGREALLQEISKQKAASKHSFPRRYFVVGDAIACIQKVPDADVAPVVHGQWIRLQHSGVIIRSNCGRNIRKNKGNDYANFEPYCPSCGAKMEKGN